MSGTYRGKHKYREAAEFITIALAVYDRQNGQISRDWNQLSEQAQKEATLRVEQWEKGELSPNTPRDHMEFALYDLLIKNPKTEYKIEKKEEGALSTAEQQAGPGGRPGASVPSAKPNPTEVTNPKKEQDNADPTKKLGGGIATTAEPKTPEAEQAQGKPTK